LMKARSLKKILAEKSVYSSWLICKFFRRDRTSVIFRASGYNLALSRSTCDITLKYVLLSKLNLWQNLALKSQQI
jgi:hypothetical protein